MIKFEQTLLPLSRNHRQNIDDLFKDEIHYRTDNFKTIHGVNINNDPFLNNGWRKTILVKYDKNYNYTYNFNIQKGGTSKFHPSPQNIPNPVANTEDFLITSVSGLRSFNESDNGKLTIVGDQNSFIHKPQSESDIPFTVSYINDSLTLLCKKDQEIEINGKKYSKAKKKIVNTKKDTIYSFLEKNDLKPEDYDAENSDEIFDLQPKKKRKKSEEWRIEKLREEHHINYDCDKRHKRHDKEYVPSPRKRPPPRAPNSPQNGQLPHKPAARVRRQSLWVAENAAQTSR